jgi:peptide/nickel transport system permease protein
MMIAFLARRLAGGLMVLFATVTLVFFAVFVLGNPVDVLMSNTIDPAERTAAIERLGLDRPVIEQYAGFIINAVQGDFGNSFVYGRSAVAVIFERLPATLELAIVAMTTAIVVGIPLGMLAGLKPASFHSKAIMTGSIFGFSIPYFWIGLMFISIFAVYLHWLPSGGRGPTTRIVGLPLSILSYEGLKYLVLPALTLALYKISLIIRVSEASARNVNRQDYVRTAHARGVPPVRVVMIHVLKNAILPVITVLGVEFGTVIAYSVSVETVFSYPGMGKLLIDSVVSLDRPVIIAYVMVTSIVFVTINFLVDVIYAVLDPRVRFSGS